eukprot:6880-Pelagococcus_subviridis.AAC.6
MSSLHIRLASPSGRWSLSSLKITSLPPSRTFSRSSWLSSGCLLRDCGSSTVSRSGFSARSAPRITAAFVPVAPEV